ncbi:hypothetical protein F5B20DRAFT_540617 [Whalleya microplaca]|nr:hypothetical protein F5B20DRAFT_540617 [Whalleya microplaca]
MRYLLSRSERGPTMMPEKLPQRLSDKEASETVSQPSDSTDSTSSSQRNRSLKEKFLKTGKKEYRRFQTLHVFRFYRKPRRPSALSVFLQHQKSPWYQIIFCIILTGVASFLCLIAAYGTAAVLLCCTISKVIALGVHVERPSTYLENNEMHDAFMLSASHQNASEWNLLIGDRGVVDSLLNKPMTYIPDTQHARLAAIWFSFAHILQLAGMTFVSAQKGWDDVSLIILLTVQLAYKIVLMTQPSSRTGSRARGFMPMKIVMNSAGERRCSGPYKYLVVQRSRVGWMIL